MVYVRYLSVVYVVRRGCWLTANTLHQTQRNLQNPLGFTKRPIYPLCTPHKKTYISTMYTTKRPVICIYTSHKKTYISTMYTTKRPVICIYTWRRTHTISNRGHNISNKKKKQGNPHYATLQKTSASTMYTTKRPIHTRRSKHTANNRGHMWGGYD